jgi:hypothetical protein
VPTSPTLIKAVQAISSTLDLNKLIETLLVIALENGGAQRGVLLVMRDNLYLFGGKIPRTDSIILREV